MDYCRKCRKFGDFNISKQKYCPGCLNDIARGSGFNRYDDFKNMSFEDCHDGEDWNGFSDIRYDNDLINLISNKFPNLKYLTSFDHKSRQIVDSDKVVYLVSDSDYTLLKVGQTCNVKSRFNCYYDLSISKPLKYDIFVADTWYDQDLYEHKVRNFLEYLGFILPKDNSGKRLEYIEQTMEIR